MEAARVGSGREVVRAHDGAKVVHAGGKEHIARASDEREDTHARGIDGRWRIRGEYEDARVDSFEAPGRPEGGALGPVIGRRQHAAGPEERLGKRSMSARSG